MLVLEYLWTWVKRSLSISDGVHVTTRSSITHFAAGDDNFNGS